MRKYILAATALAATLGATTALAVDNGIYVGASVGDASVDINEGGFDIDDSATAFKVNVGWRILDWAGIEANYVDLGEVDGEFDGLGLVDEPLEYEADGINFSGLLFLPVGPVDLFARAGFHFLGHQGPAARHRGCQRQRRRHGLLLRGGRSVPGLEPFAAGRVRGLRCEP